MVTEMPEPMSTTTLFSLVALRPAISEAAKTLNQVLTAEFIKHKNLKSVSFKNDEITESIQAIGNVKTLFTGAEKPVDIYSFFCLPKVTINQKSEIIYTLDDIKTQNRILIEATVGQGKSILMRHLALQETQKKRIPIFIELKNISKEKNLNDLIREKIDFWTTNLTDEHFKLILKSGNVSLILDGFDELSSDFINQTQQQIEYYCENFKNMKLIVSSRPNHSIKFSSFFEVITVNPYDLKDQHRLIDKLVTDNDSRSVLKKSIETSTPEIQNVLTTPLMIGLYIRKFNHDFTPPENVTSFYKNIFEVVATTHDNTKGGLKRESKTGLVQNKLENLFERFCFECFLKDSTSFEKSEIVQILEKSIKKLELKVTPESTLKDFCNYLCLLTIDGENYTFIHRSVYEYYVAFFISKLQQDNAHKIISRIHHESILNFLSVLNNYYFNKFFLKSCFESFFEFIKIYAYEEKNPLPSNFLNLFTIKSHLTDTTIFIQHPFDIVKDRYFTFFHNRYFNELISKIFRIEDFNHEVLLNTNSKIDVQKTENLHNRINSNKDLRILFKKIFTDYQSCLKSIHAKENEITLDDLDDI